MNGEHLTGDGFHRTNLIVESHAEGVGRTFRGVSAPRMVYEDATHHLGGDREEMRAVLPTDPILVDQPQIGFVNERGRLQGVVAPLPTQIACRACPQISVHQIEEIVARLNVPTSPGAQQERPRSGFAGWHFLTSPQTMGREEVKVKPTRPALRTLGLTHFSAGLRVTRWR